MDKPKMPDISILTPVKNVNPEYFKDYERQISKIAGLGPRFETVFTVDNEEDQTFQLVRGFKERHQDLQVKIVSLNRKPGISNSRNVCMASASGKFIWFADYDDVFYVEGLKKMFDAALSCEDVNTVCAKVERVNYEGKLDQPDHELYKRLDGKTVSDKKIIAKLLDFAHIGLTRFMFRREFLEASGIKFNLNVSVMEDFEFLYRFFARHPKTLVIDAMVYRYIKHENKNAWQKKWNVNNPCNPSRTIANLAKCKFLGIQYKP